MIKISSQNCWEFKKCGRELDGEKVAELGVCPAAIFVESDGFQGGKNGGRGCVYITGTFCSGVIQGTFKEKEKNCIKCDFYHLVKGNAGGTMTVMAFYDYVKKEQ